MDATCGPEMREELLAPSPDAASAKFTLCVFQTTVSRGEKVARVLCCWSGGWMDKNREAFLSPVGRAAVDALMRLPACMDDQLAETARLVIRELRVGPTPLQDKVIDAILEAKPGDRYCFVGDLAGELSGKMFPTFNVTDVLFVDPANDFR